RLLLTIDDRTRSDRTLALLGAAAPGRFGSEIRFFADRGGSGVGPEAIRHMLQRLDEEGITGTLELVSSDAAPAEPELSRHSLADTHPGGRQGPVWDVGGKAV